MTSVKQCVYCGATSSAFNKEHVLPQMFGRFKKNLTIKSVCSDCNNRLSKLELSFGRDSAEAVQRLRYGLKPMEEAHQVGRRRLRDTFINVPGEYLGARIQLIGESERLGAQFAPQVGFLKDGEPRAIWFDEDQLTVEAVAPYAKKFKRVVLGSSQEELDRLEQKLRDLGLQVEKSEPLEFPIDDGEQITVIAKYALDDSMFRVIAKIAFNYVVYCAGETFIHQKDFDPIREYIIQGTRPSWEPVIPTNDKILFDESQSRRRDNLHLVTVGWDNVTRSLIGQVSFFNQFTYRQVLCVSFGGLWTPLKSGHVYSLLDREVKPLKAL